MGIFFIGMFVGVVMVCILWIMDTSQLEDEILKLEVERDNYKYGWNKEDSNE